MVKGGGGCYVCVWVRPDASHLYLCPLRIPHPDQHLIGFHSTTKPPQLELARCILDPKCLANIICLNTCNGRSDEVRKVVMFLLLG